MRLDPVVRETPAPRGLHWSWEDNYMLRRLVNQAFDLREGPYLREACEAIVNWWELSMPDRMEQT